MKEKNKLIIAILSVVLIVAVVVGATFAWWTWSSNAADNTNVTFTVTSGSDQLKAVLDADTTSFTGMGPAANCKGTYAKKATVKLFYLNQTGFPATIASTLKLAAEPTSTHSGTINKAKINWALTSVDNATACTSGKTGYIASGTLEGKAANATLYSGDLGVGTIATGTAFANPNKTLYLYFWIDSSYNYNNNGNSVVTDPMQDMTIKVAWSGTIQNAAS